MIQKADRVREQIPLSPAGAAWVVSAKYVEQDVPEYQGNPLIEALPPVLTTEQAAESLAHFPDYKKSLRDQPDHVRQHLIQTGMRFFQPLGVHLDLQRRFSNLIRIGYVARNPFTSNYWRDMRLRQASFDQYDDQPDFAPGGFEALAAGFHLVGISGVGKTVSVSRILKLYPQIIRHSYFGDRAFTQAQLTWLKLDCPFDGNPRGLCIEFFKTVDRVLGTAYERNYAKGRTIQDELRSNMATVAANHQLGVLVIDEIQRLNLAKSGGAERMLNFFTQLVNTIGVPVVLIGTYKALPVLSGDFSQMRRGTGQGDLIWDRMARDEQWQLFVESLWRFQYLRHASPFEKSTKLVDVLYDETQGITDLAVKLFMFAQERAIESGGEKITADVIRSAARDKFGMLRRVLKALKDNEKGALETYEDVYPTVFKDYLHALPEGSGVHVTGKLDSSPVMQLMAQPDAEVNTGTPVEEAIQPTLYVAAKATRESARQARKAQGTAIEGSLPPVLRPLVGKNNTTAYDALKGAGFIRPVREFIERQVF
ncbi:MAG: hypothetical protein QOE46_1240 [Acidobacteriota bacterium]|jgi:hypothetical protein|nr:hypothetical protein [Acidobacteriota bacterium]